MVAVYVTEVPLQMDVVEAPIVISGVTGAFTVITTLADTADVGAAQSAFEVSTTVTLSLLLSVEVVNESLFDPAFTPFTFHWYEGEVPPFTGVAAKVMLLPIQMFVADACTVTEGTRAGFAFSLILFDVAVGLVTQVTVEVISTYTLSVPEIDVLVKVLLFVPAFTPFTFHWYEGEVPPLTGVAV